MILSVYLSTQKDAAGKLRALHEESFSCCISSSFCLHDFGSFPWLNSIFHICKMKTRITALDHKTVRFQWVNYMWRGYEQSKFDQEWVWDHLTRLSFKIKKKRPTSVCLKMIWISCYFLFYRAVFTSPSLNESRAKLTSLSIHERRSQGIPPWPSTPPPRQPRKGCGMQPKRQGGSRPESCSHKGSGGWGERGWGQDASQPQFISSDLMEEKGRHCIQLLVMCGTQGLLSPTSGHLHHCDRPAQNSWVQIRKLTHPTLECSTPV